MDDDWVTVAPDYLALGDTARALLDLARDPRDVRTDGNGSEFRVPPYLADLYNAPVASPAPAPKRRRSPKEGDE
jgi:hypothetical protein